MNQVPSKRALENLTAFGQLALKLDTDFSELDRLAGQIQRLEIESDAGHAQAVKLLTQFALHGQSITEGIQEFSKTLQAAREKSEAAAVAVSERANLLHQRQQERERLHGRLVELERRIREATQETSGLAQAGTGTEDEKARLTARLRELDSRLEVFVEEARSVQSEAGGANFQQVSRDAESLAGTLSAMRGKLGSVL